MTQVRPRHAPRHHPLRFSAIRPACFLQDQKVAHLSGLKTMMKLVLCYLIASQAAVAFVVPSTRYRYKKGRISARGYQSNIAFPLVVHASRCGCPHQPDALSCMCQHPYLCRATAIISHIVLAFTSLQPLSDSPSCISIHTFLRQQQSQLGVSQCQR